MEEPRVARLAMTGGLLPPTLTLTSRSFPLGEDLTGSLVLPTPLEPRR